MAKDAISGYIASLRKHNEPVPTDEESCSLRSISSTRGD